MSEKMRSKGFDGMACSIAEVMGAVNDRWGLLVMRDLLLGLTRFDDLRRSSGVTNATLSDRLKGLEASGLVERRQYQTRPARYEYVPTEKGQDLAMLMLALVQVGDKWRRRQGQGVPLRFVDAGSSHVLRLATIDADTGAILTAPKIAVEAGPGADEIMGWRIARGREGRTG
ncbi:winged helix-turn-helix transcriptional regulator [Sphingomonas morindae]|uniref:Helix-turn-helix transcriptional regulator n=1 Tax=Sphingomonas morindae TaxID=1541170 RepID=A0ABY4X3V6_9SPHN|nr:helix-turn-helix domain-containing protein [Sphingomonas morindae]USI71572.1 helix-turn-helix transcriptional regulator [Sphingomonas morindae]